ncbi:MAG: hypothetical protein ACK55Z_16965, partial [bacterium]
MKAAARAPSQIRRRRQRGTGAPAAGVIREAGAAVGPAGACGTAAGACGGLRPGGMRLGIDLGAVAVQSRGWGAQLRVPRRFQGCSKPESSGCPTWVSRP